MVERAQPLNLLLGLLIAAPPLLALWALLAAGLDVAALAQPWLWRAAGFTLMQAGLSALLAVGLAVPVARALARLPERGQGFVLLPFVLPALVGALAVHGIWHEWTGAGLGLILLAHVFFNLPLAARVMQLALLRLPPERWRLAAQLALGPWARWRFIEWPALRPTLLPLLAMIFLICLTSFGTVMVLGGGPRATTLELAIHAALRLEFDLPRAATLALGQMAVGLLALALVALIPSLADRNAQDHRLPPAPFVVGLGLGLVAVLIGLPLLWLLGRGVMGLGELPSSFWAALGRSLLLALPAGLLASAAALLLALHRQGWAAQLPLLLPPVVMGTGALLWLGPVGPSAVAIVLLNALTALPFAFALLRGPVAALQAGQGRLAQQLGLSLWTRLRLVWWPGLRTPLRTASGVAMALSLGELGAAALFADPTAPTAPAYLWRLMGSYQMSAAAGAALVLALVAALLLKGGRHDPLH